jgi:hypothetical protein
MTTYLKEDADRVLLPAVRTFKYVLQNFAREAGPNVSFELNFKVATGEREPVEAKTTRSVTCHDAAGRGHRCSHTAKPLGSSTGGCWLMIW